MKKNVILLALVLGGAVLMFLFIYPRFSQKDFSYGLDIYGGTVLIYEADLHNISPAEYSSAMNGLKDVIERRVNYSGIKEPRISVEKIGEHWRLRVELAGIKDVDKAIKMIGQTPYLEFRELKNNPESTDKDKEEKLEFQPTILTGKYLERAELGFDPTTSLPVVNLQFNSKGTKIFAELTKKNLNKPLAIYLDGQPISIPVVREVITSGRAQISGKFTVAEARTLVQRLNQGALPVPIHLISQQTISPILGSQSLLKIKKAGLWGFVGIIIFMIIVYGYEGFLASLSLIIYLLISLTIFKALPVTLTLAGITGFILSIGMAVDANILIFEYSKERYQQGISRKAALREGFKNAWPAIRDSNISTIISAIILYYFTSSLVRGFALTLAIGTAVSIVTAIYITRLFIETLLPERKSNS